MQYRTKNSGESGLVFVTILSGTMIDLSPSLQITHL